MVLVDSKGRVVLPQELREQLGLTPETEVNIREDDGKLIVEPGADPVQIIDRMDQLIHDTSARADATTPLDDGDRPVAHTHRAAVRRGATTDDDE